MNQQILFNDQFEIDMQQQWLRFNAMVSGQQVGCYISVPSLSHLAQSPLETELQIGQAFEKYRFDLEDEAETLIDEENYDAQGRIWLQHDPI
ncbi:DUF1488 family protein [Ferrimonas aestuarii]|uniref:DUF1488 domain-containing protein n=1 Tax=Ferrimonas aestuarii TaxID=2569539 RepID=A0A4U1BK08_9GAMM|nr:DUF1488 domain-containing protein [Ferrimonas aestuarii]MCK5885410.1 DUF1488 domain-containing protein [Alcanivorax sp.]TKB51924.1 DUF1488 domain-containing protein [Ferrimonas aestuarii]|tara:strand:+ start:50 stop:325 length:276 start_codon:yes stop_codon:yes gene_type:complete